MRTEAIMDAMMEAKKFLRLAHSVMDCIAKEEECRQDSDMFVPRCLEENCAGPAWN